MKTESKFLGRGMRKYIRQEKARIRREVSDLAGQKELIREVFARAGVANYPLK